MNNIKNLTLVGIFAGLIVIGTFIRIPIPVVPFTLQFLFTTLSGIILGPKLGFLSVCIYIALGLIGLPVFSNGGGIYYIFQPTFGYIIGFALGSFITGAIANKNNEITFKRTLIANFIGLFIVYLIGMVYYYLISNFYVNEPIELWPLFLYCFLLAVPGDILLCVVAAICAKRLIPILRR